MGPAPLEGAVKEMFPHTRKPLKWWRRGLVGQLQSHAGECSNRGAEGKVERFPHRGSVATSTHQSERLLCSLPGQLEIGRASCRERV